MRRRHQQHAGPGVQGIDRPAPAPQRGRGGRRRVVAMGLGSVLVLAGCGNVEDPSADELVGSASEHPANAEAPADTDDRADAVGADDAADIESREPSGTQQATGVGDEPALTLVATSAPITDLVARVGGERVQVTSMVAPGADAHTYEPRPQDVVVLSGADAYLGVGLGLNEAMVRLAAANLPDGAPVVLLGEVALVDDELVFDHGHTHDGDDLGPNPHVWTSVTNAMRLVDAIEVTLTDLDPDGAASYADNAAALGASLDELHLDIRAAATTIPASNRTLVTYHDAWTYFARDYDLGFATAIQPSDYAEPSANEVRGLIDLIRELDVPVVFGSEEFPTPVLQTIAEETEARYVADLTDDVLPGDPGDPGHSYLAMMRGNAASIIGELGGDVRRLER